MNKIRKSTGINASKLKFVSKIYKIQMKLDSDIFELADHEENTALFYKLTLEASSINRENPSELLQKVLPFMSKYFSNFNLEVVKTEGKEIAVTYEGHTMDPYKTLGDLFVNELATKNDVLKNFIVDNMLADVKLTVFVGGSLYENRAKK